MKEAIDYIAEAWNNVTQKTIQNCWIKTGIIPSYDDDMDDTDDDVNIQDLEEENEIEVLLNELPETDEIREYFQILDQEIPTEKHLTEEQIINMVQTDKDQEREESENDDDDEEVPSVPVKKAIDGLETFISF